MKRFFLGKFSTSTPPAPEAAKERALRVVAAYLGDTPLQKASYNEAIAKGPRGDAFGWDFTVEAWLGEDPAPLDFGKGVAAARDAGIDPQRSRTVLADEKLIMEGAGQVKGTFLSRRHPEWTVPQYLAYWRGNHVAVIQAQKDFYPYVRRYVQNHFVEGSYQSLEGERIAREDAYDGAPQMWFDSPDAMYDAFKTSGYKDFIREDEKIFLKFGFSQSFIAREHEVALPLPRP